MHCFLNVPNNWLLNNFFYFVLHWHFHSSDYWDVLFNYFRIFSSQNFFNANHPLLHLFDRYFNYLLDRNWDFNNVLYLFSDDVINEDWSLYNMLYWDLYLFLNHLLIRNWFLNDIFYINWSFDEHINVFINRNFYGHFDNSFNYFFHRHWSLYNLFNRSFYNPLYWYLDDFIDRNLIFLFNNSVNINWFVYYLVSVNVLNLSIEYLGVSVISNISFVDIYYVFLENHILPNHIIRDLHNSFILFVYVDFVFHWNFNDFFNWNFYDLFDWNFQNLLDRFFNDNLNDFLSLNCSFDRNIYYNVISNIDSSFDSNWNFFNNFDYFFPLNCLDFLSSGLALMSNIWSPSSLKFSLTNNPGFSFVNSLFSHNTFQFINTNQPFGTLSFRDHVTFVYIFRHYSRLIVHNSWIASMLSSIRRSSVSTIMSRGMTFLSDLRSIVMGCLICSLPLILVSGHLCFLPIIHGLDATVRCMLNFRVAVFSDVGLTLIIFSVEFIVVISWLVSITLNPLTVLLIVRVGDMMSIVIVVLLVWIVRASMAIV